MRRAQRNAASPWLVPSTRRVLSLGPWGRPRRHDSVTGLLPGFLNIPNIFQNLFHGPGNCDYSLGVSPQPPKSPWVQKAVWRKQALNGLATQMERISREAGDRKGIPDEGKSRKEKLRSGRRATPRARLQPRRLPMARFRSGLRPPPHDPVPLMYRRESAPRTEFSCIPDIGEQADKEQSHRVFPGPDGDATAPWGSGVCPAGPSLKAGATECQRQRSATPAGGATESSGHGMHTELHFLPALGCGSGWETEAAGLT